MDSAIRELICEDSSDSQESIVSVSSSVSSASYVSSVGSPKRPSAKPYSPKKTTPIKSSQNLSENSASLNKSPQKRLSSSYNTPPTHKDVPKKIKLELIEELRSLIHSADSDASKVQKAKHLFEMHPKQL